MGLNHPPAVLALGELCVSDPWFMVESDEEAAERAEFACRMIDVIVETRSRAIAAYEARAPEYLAAFDRWLARHAKHPWENDSSGKRQLFDAPQLFVAPPDVDISKLMEVPLRWITQLAGLSTTTALSTGGPPFTHARGPGKKCLWSIVPRGPVRRLEIVDGLGWRQLIEAYPQCIEQGPVSVTPNTKIPGPLYGPSWIDVAGDWDAVRFTMSGKLRTLFVPMRVFDGWAMLCDENYLEETRWLRPPQGDTTNHGLLEAFYVRGKPTGFPTP